MVTPVLHVMPLIIRSPYLSMIALLLRAFRDFDVVRTSPSCTRLFRREQRQIFLRLRRAEWFSSSSPAAGLGRAIFSAFLSVHFFLRHWIHK